MMGGLDTLEFERSSETQLLMEQFLNDRLGGLRTQVETKEDPPTLKDVVSFLENHLHTGMDPKQFSIFKKMFKGLMDDGYFADVDGTLTKADHHEWMMKNSILMSYMVQYITQWARDHSDVYGHYHKQFIDAKSDLYLSDLNTSQLEDAWLFGMAAFDVNDPIRDEDGDLITDPDDKELRYNKLVEEYEEFMELRNEYIEAKQARRWGLGSTSGASRNVFSPTKPSMNRNIKDTEWEVITDPVVKKERFKILMQEYVDYHTKDNPQVDYTRAIALLKKHPLYTEIDRESTQEALIGTEWVFEESKWNSLSDRFAQIVDLVGKNGLFEAWDSIDAAEWISLKDTVVESMEYALLDARLIDNNALYTTRKQWIIDLIKKYDLTGISLSSLEKSVEMSVLELMTGRETLESKYFTAQPVTAAIKKEVEAITAWLEIWDFWLTQNTDEIVVIMNEEISKTFWYLKDQKRFDLFYEKINDDEVFGEENLWESTQLILSGMLSTKLLRTYKKLTDEQKKKVSIGMKKGVETLFVLFDTEREWFTKEKSKILDEINKEIAKENKKAQQQAEIDWTTAVIKPSQTLYSMEYTGAWEEYLVQAMATRIKPYTDYSKLSDEQIATAAKEFGHMAHVGLRWSQELSAALALNLTIGLESINNIQEVQVTTTEEDNTVLSSLDTEGSEHYRVFFEKFSDANIYTDYEGLSEITKNLLISNVANSFAAIYKRGEGTAWTLNTPIAPTEIFFVPNMYPDMIKKKQKILAKSILDKETIWGGEDSPVAMTLDTIEYEWKWKEYLEKTVASAIQQSTDYLGMSDPEIALVATEIWELLHEELKNHHPEPAPATQE